MKTIDIWNGNAPYGGGSVQMHCYEPEVKKGDGAVIIFSGGGYSHRAYHEGEPYALELNRMGLWAFVVDYRVAPSQFPAPLLDAQKAVSYVRCHSADFQINTEKIAVMGSSAGGHLAALCATNKWHIPDMPDLPDEERLPWDYYFPNAQILCYPVTDIESHKGSFENLMGDYRHSILPEHTHMSLTPTYEVEEDTAIPTFIWHTSCDDVVDVKGTYRYATRLSELGASVEMHIYPVGCHGLGLATGDPKREPVEYVQRWIEDLERWLKLIGWITE